MEPLLLWSDMLIYLLVIVLCLFFWRLRRDPQTAPERASRENLAFIFLAEQRRALLGYPNSSSRSPPLAAASRETWSMFTVSSRPRTLLAAAIVICLCAIPVAWVLLGSETDQSQRGACRP